MEGTIVSKHVWCLPSGRRIIVHFNEYGQPIRRGGLVLVHFLSELSKDGTFCPLGAQNWKRVDDDYKQRIIKTVWDKFVLPDTKEIHRMVLSHINMKWKQYKWELQKRYYQPNVSKEKIIENMPKNVIKEQWISLVSYWASEKFKKLSTLGKRAREMHTQVHTTRSKSYAQWKIEFAKLNQREPSGLEMWKRTHTTKSSGYVEGTCTQELMDIAESRVNERLRDSDQPREVIETEVFNEIMHQEDKPNKRVVGYGLGVNRSHVFGIEAQLRKDKIGDCGGSSSDVMGLKSYLLSIERKNDELMRRNDEVMRQNDELMRRNDEVMRKKDEEVEELRAQNQKILSQLALVLDQLQQNQKTIG